MIDASAHDTHHLLTEVNSLYTLPLVIPGIPLPNKMLHLSMVVGSKGELLHTMASSDQACNDEVLEG